MSRLPLPVHHVIQSNGQKYTNLCFNAVDLRTSLNTRESLSYKMLFFPPQDYNLHFFFLKTAERSVFISLSEEDLKPPPYSECTLGDEAAAPRPAHQTPLISQGGEANSVSEAPPPYTPGPPAQVSQQTSPVSHSESQSESRPA